jgi:hypothetical protein
MLQTKRSDRLGPELLEGRTIMNFKSRTIRGALVAVVVALSVASIPAAGGAADAGHGNQETKAILKAIL